MIILSLLCLLVGAVLGQYFKIRVLIPASVIVLLLAVGTGVTYAHSAWSIILTASMASISIQIGYFIGIVIHHFRGRDASYLAPPPHRSLRAQFGHTAPTLDV
jgi:hypothetical protein